MSKEVLQVEFDVQKTIERPYGFQEKLLKFRDGNTRYKGIVKNGKLVAILGRGYKLVPNERIEEIVDKLGLDRVWRINKTFEGWKIFVRVWDGDNGVLVRNSVDGTTSLRVDAILKIGENGSFGVLVGTKIVETVYRRHTQTVNIEDLEAEIDSIWEASEKYGEWLGKMDKVKAKDNKETLQTLFDQLPKVYTKGLESMLAGISLNGEPTVKDVYEAIAKRIWSRDNTMTTKLHLFQLINDVIFICVGL